MTTATMGLEEQVRVYMTGLADDDYATWCEDCGESVAPAFADRHDGLCPRCHRRAQLDDARSDLDEARSDLESALEEMKELCDRIAEAKDAIKSARARLASLKS
jgi:DNA repair ATPase RecN